MPLATIPKVLVYLTRHDRDLLLLAHPLHPEAGLQVPAGTIEPGETPEQAALRELAEETGLKGCRLLAPLGEGDCDMRPYGKAERHHRHFFHAVLTGTAPERWSHTESNAGPDPIPIELFWWNLTQGPPGLIAGHDDLLPELQRRLSLSPAATPAGGRPAPGRA